MSGRQLHDVADRILREARLLDRSGLLLSSPVDVEGIAERLQGLVIVGSEGSGRWRLPHQRKGEIRIESRHIVVNHKLLDDDGFDVQYREVIAHEIAHDLLHGVLIAQRALPFPGLEGSNPGRRQFSRTEADALEKEAIYLGALLQIPVSNLKAAIRPAICQYATADWIRVSSQVEVAEAVAAQAYRTEAPHLAARALRVDAKTAMIALDYWDANDRPPPEWIREVSGAS